MVTKNPCLSCRKCPRPARCRRYRRCRAYRHWLRSSWEFFARVLSGV